MASEALAPSVLARLRQFQQVELSESLFYAWLARRSVAGKNREVFEQLATDERRHYEEWKRLTGADARPLGWRLFLFKTFTVLFGFTFAIKLMEAGEDDTGDAYRQLAHVVPGIEAIAREEDEHERMLMSLLDEERLRYVGSIVLGLNDALVELTGALAGLTLALRNTRLIAMTGAITGIAAALSMAASEYLSIQTESGGQNPLKGALYTGSAYIATVILLVLPYLLVPNYFAALAFTLAGAVGIIAFFNYYIAVAREEPFRRRFLEMAGLSLSVAAFSFGVGFVMRTVFKIDI